MLACELCGRASHVSVSWVLGHAKKTDVLRGRTTEEDKRGNDGADQLARDGAAQHAAPAEVVTAARTRIDTASSVQGMMLAVLEARFMAESTGTNDADHEDRGSDAGDFGLDDEFGEREYVLSGAH